MDDTNLMQMFNAMTECGDINCRRDCYVCMRFSSANNTLCIKDVLKCNEEHINVINSSNSSDSEMKYMYCCCGGRGCKCQNVCQCGTPGKYRDYSTGNSYCVNCSATFNECFMCGIRFPLHDPCTNTDDTTCTNTDDASCDICYQCSMHYDDHHFGCCAFGCPACDY